MRDAGGRRRERRLREGRRYRGEAVSVARARWIECDALGSLKPGEVRFTVCMERVSRIVRVDHAFLGRPGAFFAGFSGLVGASAAGRAVGTPVLRSGATNLALGSRFLSAAATMSRGCAPAKRLALPFP